MSEPEQRVSLANLGRGAAIERFDQELGHVWANIVDPNTTDSVREVTLKVRIKPDRTRFSCQVTVQCSSKLAPTHPVPTTVFVAKDGSGKAVASEANPTQLSIPGTEEEAPRAQVYELKGGKP